MSHWQLVQFWFWFWFLRKVFFFSKVIHSFLTQGLWRGSGDAAVSRLGKVGHLRAPLTWRNPNGWCLTPPDFTSAGHSASGDRGTWTRLEFCPHCSSLGPRMVKVQSCFLENVFLVSPPATFHPALLHCSLATLVPPARPGQELPSCHRNPG